MAGACPSALSGLEKAIAGIAALAVFGLAGYMLIDDRALANDRQFFVLRLMLAIAAAIFAATVPGFLNVEWRGKGLIVRAGGALAVFALVYLFTPNPPPAPSPVRIEQRGTGDGAPNIINNTGTITIQR